MVRTRPREVDTILTEAGRGRVRLVVREPEDTEAFADLYRRYLAPVYGYCARRLPTPEDAEDATSLVFTKALTTLAAQRDPATLRAWLFAIAHNVVADHFRSRRPTVSLTDMPPIAWSGTERPEAQALAEETIRSLLAQLSAEQARIVELRMAGLTGTEIARALGKTPNAVKVAQFRAYSRLRDLVAGLPAEQARGEPA